MTKEQFNKTILQKLSEHTQTERLQRRNDEIFAILQAQLTKDQLWLFTEYVENEHLIEAECNI